MYSAAIAYLYLYLQSPAIGNFVRQWPEIQEMTLAQTRYLSAWIRHEIKKKTYIPQRDAVLERMTQWFPPKTWNLHHRDRAEKFSHMMKNRPESVRASTDHHLAELAHFCLNSGGITIVASWPGTESDWRTR